VQALRAGDAAARAALGRSVVPLVGDNLVARPWGGEKIFAYKGIDRSAAGGRTIGEVFEVAADTGDPEAREHPSEAILPDGSRMPLPELLVRAGAEILGGEFAGTHGYRWPLLPKILDVRELLSVQAHPPGCTELYVILSADPGATFYVGFRQDVDAAVLRDLVRRGRQLQEMLVAALRDENDALALHNVLAPLLAKRDARGSELAAALRPLLREGDEPAGAPAGRPTAAPPVPPANEPTDNLARPLPDQLAELHRIYWAVLDAMNALPVAAGQVVLNAVPAPTAADEVTTAVHALGNPVGREVLMLEVRRPCPTLRVWDNARFPMREIDADGALAAMPLAATPPHSLMVVPQPAADRPGVWRVAATPHFVVDLLRPTANVPVPLPEDGQPRSLHVLQGSIAVVSAAGSEEMRLGAGEAALLPAGLGAAYLEVVQTSGTAASAAETPVPATESATTASTSHPAPPESAEVALIGAPVPENIAL
jgi:hypothetical protein